MNIYLVGGAVRDKLLGIPVKDKDWVVVGATPDDMLAQGYQQVGKDFPVFIHPETGEEYALARTERKTGKGYTGFDCYAAPDVTLEDDLKRRDLTINAIAESESGELIDPYEGQKDLKQKILRHISPAFVEDPLRVLRVARFAAQLDFTIADDTKALLENMVQQGELKNLVAERVWVELDKSLSTDKPQHFFQVLRDCGALQVLFSEIDNLFGVPNPPKSHPEIDSGVHTLMVLEQAALLTADNRIRFAALMHDVGKALTPADKLPQHIGHEKSGVPLVENFCERYPVPNAYQEIAVLVTRYHLLAHTIEELTPKTILGLLESLDAFRRPERLRAFLTACQADRLGRKGFESSEYPQKDYLMKAYQAANDVDVQAIIQAGNTGEKIKLALHDARIRAIKQIVNKK